MIGGGSAATGGGTAAGGGSPTQDLCGSAEKSVQQTGKHNYAEALQKSLLFFEANQMGRISPHNRFEWRSDCFLQDVKNGRDLSGGYADVGDNILFGKNHHAAVAMLALTAIQLRQELAESGQLEEILEAVKHGTDWILKSNVMQNGATKELFVQVSDGDIDDPIWKTLEETTYNRPIYSVTAFEARLRRRRSRCCGARLRRSGFQMFLPSLLK